MQRHMQLPGTAVAGCRGADKSYARADRWVLSQGVAHDLKPECHMRAFIQAHKSISFLLARTRRVKSHLMLPS